MIRRASLVASVGFRDDSRRSNWTCCQGGIPMKMMAVRLTALFLAAFCSLPADAQQRQRPYRSGSGSAFPQVMMIAQGEVRIPSDAQLERMEERTITTPPLDVREAPRVRGGRRGRDPTDGRTCQADRPAALGERRDLHRLQVNERALGRIFPRSYGAGRYLSIILGSLLVLALTLLLPSLPKRPAATLAARANLPRRLPHLMPTRT
jgi:hypothetical protein